MRGWLLCCPVSKGCLLGVCTSMIQSSPVWVHAGVMWSASKCNRKGVGNRVTDHLSGGFRVGEVGLGRREWGLGCIQLVKRKGRAYRVFCAAFSLYLQ
jgi:hypothetical protein